jgi:N-acyl-D-aspartate/D-glutamate deacylase
MLDTLLKNGVIYDGTGAASFEGDIAIKDGRIADMGRLNGATAARTVDLGGLAVSPGFIDLHTQSDFTLAADGRAQSQVHQGVTTEVVGQCGFSCAPVSNVNDLAIMAPGFTDGMVDVDWRSFGEYLDHLDKMSLGVNVAAFVGHGKIHRAVLGDALRPADDAELDRMKMLLDESIDGGGGLN